MRVTEDLKTQIKSLSIVDVGKRLGLDIKRNMCLCFNGHDKNSKSLKFDSRKGLFNCFGCDAGGDIISLVQQHQKTTFSKACQWIIQEFNLSYSLGVGKVYVRKLTTRSVKVIKSEEQEEEVNIANPDIYEWIIENSTLSDYALGYLANERKFSKQIISQLKIRDIKDTKKFFSFLSKKWGQEALLKCGLLWIDVSGVIKPIWWDHVLIFPFVNLNYRIDYLQARRFSQRGAKYLNLAKVKPSLYNLDKIANYESGDTVFLCEGIPDTITAYENGFKSIGVLGANGFKEEWVNYFRDLNIMVIPDSDKGGEKFLDSIEISFKKIGKEVKSLVVPKPYKDLNEYFIKRDNGV